MKGTEGIDYVITECGHCKGDGKCDCFQCLERVVITEDRVNDLKKKVI